MIGPEAFEVVLSHIKPEDLSEKSYQELTNILDKYYAATRNQVALRLKFRSRKQQPDETIADYILELKKLSRHCGYGDQLETNLRDTFVGGLANPKVQAELLQKGDSLTWKTAREDALAIETALKDSKQLSGLSEGPGRTVDQSSSSGKLQRQLKVVSLDGGRGRSQGQRKANVVSPEDSDSRDTSEEVDFIGTLSQTTQLTKEVPPYTVVMRVKDTYINFTVDTAASVTVISETEFHKLFPDLTLEKARINLKSYSGDSIALAAETQVKVTYEDKIYMLPLVVVKGNKVALLGRNWLKHIKLQWENIFSVGHTENAVKQVLHKYESVFKAAGPGDKIKHHMAELSDDAAKVGANVAKIARGVQVAGVVLTSMNVRVNLAFLGHASFDLPVKDKQQFSQALYDTADVMDRMNEIASNICVRRNQEA
ncbi:hypothetical protein HOLleu_04354 [Holothuria leucospilota]|uniref:Peptidase A2 domain-containing protein n=1 Tax=Holothuria leucospilota TaxID=206669 RepID=A0A9Q1CSU4_HOLLE|nr:hypothetical protein HOLleu_04354 [Holothuria leucospilota]